MASSEPDDDTETLTCWICHSDQFDDPTHGPMIQPCACRGSQRLCHRGCIEAWLRARFDAFNATSVPAAYCAATKEDDVLAHRLFNVTQFVTPGWRDASYVCPDTAESDVAAWATAWRRDYCAYGLLPSSECPPGFGMEASK